MNFKIFVRKKDNFDIKSKKLHYELCKNNDFFSIKKVIIYYVYHIFNIKKDLFLNSLWKLFADPVTDILYQKKIFTNPHFELLSYKDEIREKASEKCIKTLYPQSNVSITTNSLIELIGLRKKIDLDKIKNFFHQHNNYGSIISYQNKNIKIDHDYSKDKNILNNFFQLTHENLIKFHKNHQLSMDFMDLLFVQKYFIKEKRNPTNVELHVIDTYWSDHCRHTTFFTKLENISFHGSLKNTYQNVFNQYLRDRYDVGRSDYPINFMDISTLPYKMFYKTGKLKHYALSYENNASMISIDVNIKNKKKEKWYLLFKNETHNHPTEIDPFGGAYTCIGGAIRDPLSGRSFVYQSIRISGSANPTIYETFYGKIPQHKICIESANGSSSYGNQIGLSTTHIHEIYHEGYRAKRMEVGFVIGATPVDCLKQEKPKNGDIVLLIGGLTDREGIGSAVDSSQEGNKILKKNIKKHNANPLVERKIQRFFQKKNVTILIKKCNDFGAGGAAIAISELNNSIELYLDKIPIKNKVDMKAIEIALSESQERMAVVLDPKNVDKFIKLAKKENIIPIPIAKITDNGRIIFFYKKKKILDISSSFLNTGGFSKKNSVVVHSPISISPFKKSKKISFNKEIFLHTLSKLNIASQKSLVEIFDSTVGGTTVLMPFGGKYQLTPSEGSVHKIPIKKGETDTVSLASWGYHPYVSSWSPFHGGAYSIVECVSKIVAMGGNYKNIYFSFQEYYKKLGSDPKNWGIPFSSLLGAYHAQMSLELASLGGKDSMSGTYKKFHVPPTFISFGISVGSCLNITSPEFKKIGNKIYLYNHIPLPNEMPNFDSIKKAYHRIYKGICSGDIVSVKTLKDGGISIAIATMVFGNRLGASINCKNNLLETHIGSLIVESNTYISEDNFILIGEIISSQNMIFNDLCIDIDDAIQNWMKTFHPIFSYEEYHKIQHNNKKKKNIFTKKMHHFHTKKGCKFPKIGKPRVFIPIFPGTNGEMESIRIFQKEGALIKTFVFQDFSDQKIYHSILNIKKCIESVQILMFCGGFTLRDEPDGAGKFIVSILQNPHIKESIQKFLNKNGLILGICNGFQGLIKTGLLPYGTICLRNKFSPTLIRNKINKHISQCVHIKIISDHSPWLNGMKNKIYTLPISHGEGRFYAKNNVINILFNKNQIASQYVNLKGNPSLDRMYNPNGSIHSIEGLLSENGHIYGTMTHPERYDNGLLKNIPNIHKYSIFKNAVQYFL
ncbi:phosphoribosylformylglycinamidine synthase [Blattabacterium cuenoti]|uniref:phosphoribosylformylglycinamidine synthase n=1 Tax=Blattabacterium cuenoti TaxID=1653831 RepID=UPI00163C8C9D|nr:phosphoribosylformylglycinamidine synthase [Blattabacterium cuenoti]